MPGTVLTVSAGDTVNVAGSLTLKGNAIVEDKGFLGVEEN